MFNILGFAKCQHCGNREIYFGDSKAAYIELFAPWELKNRWYMICAKPDEPEHGCEEDVDATLVLLPSQLPKKFIRRIGVEYDADLGKPLSFSLNEGDKNSIEVNRIKAFVKLPDRHFAEDISLSNNPFGIYIVEVANGDCMIEAQPHIEADDTKNWNTPEWYLIDIEPGCKFAEDGKTPIRFTSPRNGPSIPSPRKEICEPTNYNFKAYQILFRLEPRLRYFIFSVFRSKYSQKHGEKWWEAIIPSYVINQAKEARERQQNPFLTETEKFHPLCYTTFAHLRVIIKEKWEDFKNILPNKNTILGDLWRLEYFRNEVAHNRPIKEKEYHALENISSSFQGTLRKLMKDNKLR